MAKDYLKAFTVDYDCYYKNDYGTPDDPKITNANGALTVFAHDISEAIEISKKKLTGFVGDSVEITSVSKGYNNSRYAGYFRKENF